MANEDAIVGGWTPYTTEISAQEKALLQKAVGVGVTYSAVAMSTQEAQSKNFSFFCNTKDPKGFNTAKIVQFIIPLRSDTPENVKILDVPREE